VQYVVVKAVVGVADGVNLVVVQENGMNTNVLLQTVIKIF